MIISAATDYRAAAQRRLPPFLFHYVDGGAYAEHRIDSIALGGRTVAVGGRHATLRLAPGCGARLSLLMTRYANRPTLAFPWDR